MTNEEIVEARNNYFNKLKQKNEINHSRIDELDLDNIGIVLNYQQVDLMNLALKGNKISYKKYQDSLFDLEDFNTESGKRKRDLLITYTLSNDLDLPEKVRLTLTKIYEETKKNKSITDDVIVSTLQRLISKLSTDLQKIIYSKINKLCIVSYEGIKDMSYDEALKLYDYIKNDYTSITIDVSKYSMFVNPNGTYNKTNLNNMLSFAYENDLQVRIRNVMTYEEFPTYLKKQSKDMVKQKLINYIDYLTKYVKNYNATHKRTDRRPVIRSIDIISNLITNETPYEWRGKKSDILSSGWLSHLSLEDLCDCIEIARKNLPNIEFVYNESLLNNKEKRLVIIELLKVIKSYEKKKNIKLIDTLGISMHFNLDVLKEDIVNMFKELSELTIPLAITEFDLCATIDMINHNNSVEIEILRDRFISDLCNIITSLNLSKEVLITSIDVDSVNDNQNHMLTIINEELKDKKLPLLKTIYGGIYDNKMERKEVNTRLHGIRIKGKGNNSGIVETMYVGAIIVVLLLVVAVVCYLFIRFI